MTILIATAMKEEAQPFLHGAEPVETPLGTAWEVMFRHKRVIMLVTGVGLVNAAATVAAAIVTFSPRAILNPGASGGLSQGIFVGDVVIGSSCTYHDADSTAFSYALGQIPGMPEQYEADPELLRIATSVTSDYRIRKGRVVAGNSFVADHLVESVRKAFPSALAADMESTAVGQVAHRFALPFLPIRAISDLCGPTASRDFSLSLDEAAARAASVATSIIDAY